MAWRKTGTTEAAAQTDEIDCTARAGINRVAPMASGSTTSTYAGAGGSVVSLSSPQREGAAGFEAFRTGMAEWGYRPVPAPGD